MKNSLIRLAVAALSIPSITLAANPIQSITKEWTYKHVNTGVAGQISEISAYDAITNTI